MRILGFDRLPEGGSDEIFDDEYRESDFKHFVGIESTKSVGDRSNSIG